MKTIDMGTWRYSAIKVIGAFRKDHPDLSGEALRNALRSVYPFYERKYYPYKVWCEEVNKACGTYKKKARKSAKKSFVVDPNQGVLL